MARRWASAWARTLAKPAGLVMRAAWPASELAQRLPYLSTVIVTPFDLAFPSSRLMIGKPKLISAETGL